MAEKLKEGSLFKGGEDVSAECVLDPEKLPVGWTHVSHKKTHVGGLYAGKLSLTDEAEAAGYRLPKEEEK